MTQWLKRLQLGGFLPLLMVLSLTLLVLPACSTDKAPPIAFKTIDGSVFQPSDYKGKVMLVNFWATSCTTCIKEMPGLIQTYQKYKDQGFQTVAVAMSYDRPDFVLNFAQTRQLPFKVALDVDGEAAKQYGSIKITPSTFLIDKKGNILKKFVGEPDFSDLQALIEKALAEQV